jgi:hypothetical protein
MLKLVDDKVTIDCATEGASIGYKIFGNGKEPTSWQVYSGPFTKPKAKNVKVVAHRIGYIPSREIVM